MSKSHAGWITNKLVENDLNNQTVYEMWEEFIEEFGHIYKNYDNYSRRVRKIKAFLKGESQVEIPAVEDTLAQELLKLLRSGSMVSLGELSRKLDRSKKTIVEVANMLHDDGYDIEYDKSTKKLQLLVQAQSDWKTTNIADLHKDKIKIGLISDTHLGSKYQQIGLVQLAYKIFEEEDVAFVLHCGDLFDGKDVYRGHRYSVWSDNADEVLDYALENYPRANFKTHIVPGNHDYSYMKAIGYNIVRSFTRFRDDIVYAGDHMPTFKLEDFDDLRLCIGHPRRGQAYAKSYPAQKIAEGISAEMVDYVRSQNSDINKVLPHAIFFGHWHTRLNMRHSGMEVFCLPGLQAATPLVKDKGLVPDLSVGVLEISRDDNYVAQIFPRWFNLSKYQKEKDY